MFMCDCLNGLVFTPGQRFTTCHLLMFSVDWTQSWRTVLSALCTVTAGKINKLCEAPALAWFPSSEIIRCLFLSFLRPSPHSFSFRVTGYTNELNSSERITCHPLELDSIDSHNANWGRLAWTETTLWLFEPVWQNQINDCCVTRAEHESWLSLCLWNVEIQWCLTLATPQATCWRCHLCIRSDLTPPGMSEAMVGHNLQFWISLDFI